MFFNEMDIDLENFIEKLYKSGIMNKKGSKEYDDAFRTLI
jgi:hypothetical protein